MSRNIRFGVPAPPGVGGRLRLVTVVGASVVLTATLLTPQASGAPRPALLSTLGGPGHAEMYPSGLEVSASGEVVVADTGNDAVTKYRPNGSRMWRYTGDSGNRDGVENARDIAIDKSGAVYVADAGKARVIKLSAAGRTLSVWKGPASDPIKSPIGITEKNGKIYVADGLRKKIRVFKPDGTQLRTIGSRGVCTMAAVRDADADAAGNVYVANYTSNNILKLSSSGKCLKVWGKKGTGNGQFKNPYGIRVAQDPRWGESVYVADSNNNRVQIFSKNGVFRGVVGRAGAPTQNGTFTTLRRVAVAKDGDVWGADLWGSRAVRFNRSSSGFGYAQTIGNGLAPLQARRVFNEPRGVAFSGDGTVNVVDTVNQRVVRLKPGGAVIGSCGTRTASPASPNWPRGVTVDTKTGHLWLADTKQNRIQIWQPNCNVVDRLGGGSGGSALRALRWPHDIEIRGSDRIAFVADSKNHRIVAYDVATRKAIKAYGSRGSGQGKFFEPRGISVAKDGSLYVADTKNNRVVQLTYTRSAGFRWKRVVTAGLKLPESAAVDRNGHLWMADTGNNRVVVQNAATGKNRVVLTNAAGSPLRGPSSIAVANNGRVHVSDTRNDRVLVYQGAF